MEENEAREMTESGYDANGEYHLYHVCDACDDGPNTSELPDEGSDFFIGARNCFAIEVLAGLVIWGLWELHRPILILAHWLVAHAL